MNISNIPIDIVFCICNHQSPNRTIALNIRIMNIRECYEYSIDIVFVFKIANCTLALIDQLGNTATKARAHDQNVNKA